MKLRTFAAACAALVSVSFAGAALADDPITAKLQNPVGHIGPVDHPGPHLRTVKPPRQNIGLRHRRI